MKKRSSNSQLTLLTRLDAAVGNGRSADVIVGIAGAGLRWLSAGPVRSQARALRPCTLRAQGDQEAADDNEAIDRAVRKMDRQERVLQSLELL
jgi:hypothetical protein